MTYENMARELYLSGAVFGLIGTVFGALITIITTKINSRTQLRLARENHQHQYQIEALKVKAQAEQEHSADLREKLEDAHQILSKIKMENSLTAGYIDWESNVTASEYDARYQQSLEHIRRLNMIVDLYFPQISTTIRELDGLTNQYWGHQQHLLYIYVQGEKDAARYPMKEIARISKEIASKVGQAQNQLMALNQQA